MKHKCPNCYCEFAEAVLSESHERQTGWIPLTERLPTEDDADEHGFVLVRVEWQHTNPSTIKTYLDIWNSVAMTAEAMRPDYHFLPLPKFQAPDKGADQWARVWKINGWELATGSEIEIAKKAWDAALEYARSEAKP